ncbi:MAG: hypothetical protein HY751_07870 [Nitrospinae bacterium]|nr:hypothetical protein [Nitrospinota bacterium]
MSAGKPMTIKVVSYWGQEAGFRLAGAEVVPVTGAEALNGEIEKILAEGGVGVLAIPAQMEEWITDRNQKALRKSVTPLLARYEYPGQWRFTGEAEDMADWLTFRAIGYHMRIKL